nr:MAG: putative RNA-dependent RNA polymerase [Narnaviridae sp.]
MNNFNLISTIDGILGRTFRVKPNPSAYPKRADQWLYVCEPLFSLENELVRKASSLRPPEFPGQGIPVLSASNPKQCSLSKATAFLLWNETKGLFDTVDALGPPVLFDGRPIPEKEPHHEHYSVDWRIVQILTGIRAVLLALVDTCAACAADADYVGLLPADDSMSAAVLMSEWPESAFVGNAKYWISWPLATFLRNPLPPMPSTWKHSLRATLFSGETGRYYRRLAIYSDSRPDSASFYRANFTISQSKRGFATVPDVYVNMSFAKHAAQLSQPSPPLSGEVRELAKRFAKTLLRNFRPKRDMFSELSRLEPSTNACVESPRKIGGAREFLRRKMMELHGREPLFLGMREVAPGQVIEERGLPAFTPGEWEEQLRQHRPTDALNYFSEEVTGLINYALYSQGLLPSDLDLMEIPICRVAPILEPLKVRMVTAMDGLLTHVATPLQMSLWNYLHSMPVFHLVGSPVTEEYIGDISARHLRAGGSRDDQWVSGDYSAATDGLCIELSKILIDEVLDKLEDQPISNYREKVRSILTEQMITYPQGSGVEPVLQRTGQLMGSKLSFPVLCMANLFAYILSLDDERQEAALRSFKVMQDLPVAINGDDILFLASPSHYDRWSEKIKLVGFTKSVGKNFFHRRFLTVNSAPIEFTWPKTPFQYWQQYSWADMEDSTVPWAVSQVAQVTAHGFLNVGLLTGQSKLTGRRKEQNIPLSEWHRRTAVSAINPVKAHGYFLHYHAKEILQQTRFGSMTLNLFAHPLKGGLGFSVPEGVEVRYSLEQRRLAEALWQSAVASYEGQESEFSLESLLILADESPSTSGTLGTRRRRVHVDLYPKGTPVPDGYRNFVDNSAVKRSVLAIGVPLLSPPSDWREKPQLPYGSEHVPSLDELIAFVDSAVAEDPTVLLRASENTGFGMYELDEPEVRAVCRLSNNKLRILTKRYYYSDHDLLHPIEDMESFPFIPICRVAETTSFQKVYSPPVVQQDIVVDPSLELESPIVPATIADWSSSTLRLPIVDSDDSWMEDNVNLRPVSPTHLPIRNRRYRHAPRGQDGITATPLYRAEFTG